ncbi:MAG: restriction endonuclease [Bacteroidota bacterium]
MYILLLFPTFFETQRRLKKIIKLNLYVDIPGNYLDTFKALENTIHYESIINSFNTNLNFSFATYYFLLLDEEIPEEDYKELETIIVQETKGIKRIITYIYKDNSNLLKIGPRQFEKMIAELLFAKGFKVELTKQTGDNGYDIIALQMVGNNFPLKFLVECKRFTKNKFVRANKLVILNPKTFGMRAPLSILLHNTKLKHSSIGVKYSSLNIFLYSGRKLSKVCEDAKLISQPL